MHSFGGIGAHAYYGYVSPRLRRSFPNPNTTKDPAFFAVQTANRAKVESEPGTAPLRTATSFVPLSGARAAAYARNHRMHHLNSILQNHMKPLEASFLIKPSTAGGDSGSGVDAKESNICAQNRK